MAQLHNREAPAVSQEGQPMPGALVEACAEVVCERLDEARRLVEETALRLADEFQGLMEAVNAQQHYLREVTLVLDHLPQEHQESIRKVLEEGHQVSLRMCEHISAVVLDMQFQDRNSQYMENARWLLQALSSAAASGISTQEAAKALEASVTLHDFRHPLLWALYRRGLGAQPDVPEHDTKDAADDGIDLF